MTQSKRQDLPVIPPDSGSLSMVATPIGNLEDLSPRARRALEDCDLVLAEDTRVARSLFQALGIPTRERRFERCDRHREEDSNVLTGWVEAARSGDRLVFVSDAGTPGISDPGAAVVRRFRDEGLTVHVLPGPSAVAAFLSGAGFVSSRFTFAGFFPRGEAERSRCLNELFSRDGEPESRIWFEAPSRIEASLDAWSRFEKEGDGSKVRLVVAKELTKLHERWLAGSPSEVYSEFRTLCAADDRFTSGEWVLGAERVGGTVKGDDRRAVEVPGITQELMNKIFGFAAELPVKSSEAAKALSHAFGVDREDAYRELLQRRKKVE